MSDGIPFTRATNRGIELEFTAVPDATLDIILGWPDGQTEWLDHQVRAFIGVLGDGVRDVAYGEMAQVRRRVLPRPLGHLLWFDRVFGMRYPWPSCLVWVPVETAAVLATPLEPLDLEAVKVHTRVRTGGGISLPRLPDLTGRLPELRMPDFTGMRSPHEMLDRIHGLREPDQRMLGYLDNALAGVMEKLQSALPEGLPLTPDMVQIGDDDPLSNDMTVRLIPERVEAEMQRRFEEQQRRIEQLFPDM